MSMEQRIAEEATGIEAGPSGIGQAYDNQGEDIRGLEVQAALQEGRTVEYPNAGAGSYREVFCTHGGFKDLKVVEQSSSAGDWTFAVYDGKVWRFASQTNRHPYHGFMYSVDYTHARSRFEDLCALI